MVPTGPGACTPWLLPRDPRGESPAGRLRWLPIAAQRGLTGHPRRFSLPAIAVAGQTSPNRRAERGGADRRRELSDFELLADLSLSLVEFGERR